MRGAALLALAVLVGGCSTRYAARPLEPAVLLRDLRAEPVQAPGDGLGPGDAVGLALQHNAELRAFRRQRNVAESRVVSASAWDNPELRLDLQAPLRFGFGLRVPIPPPGERRARTEEAKAGERRVLAEIEDRENRLAAETLIGHARVVSLEEEIAIVDASIRLHGRIAALVEQRLAAFASTEFDRALASLQRIAVRTDRETLVWHRDEALAALARSCGLPVGSIAQVRRSTEAAPPAALDGATLEAQALAHRPDLRALEEAYQEQEHRLELVHIGQMWWPRYFQPGMKKIPDKVTADLSLALPLPIFDNRGPIGEAEAQRDMARAQYVARLEASRAEVAAALAQVIAGDRRRQAYHGEIEPALGAAEKLIEGTLATGEFDALKLELLEDRILASRRLSVRADFEYERARVELALATGTVLAGKTRPAEKDR